MVLPEWADKLEGRALLFFLLSFLGLASPLGMSGDWDGGSDEKGKDYKKKKGGGGGSRFGWEQREFPSLG